MMREVPTTILAQLGGNKFLAMTGAKDLVGSDDSLWFGVSGKYNGRCINKVRISLMRGDTYSVQAYKTHRFNCDMIAEAHPVMVDGLRAAFTRLTGLATSL